MKITNILCLTLLIITVTVQISLNELQKCKELFDCLGLSKMYPVIYNMVENEFSTNNLTQISLMGKLKFLHQEMKNILGIMNVRKRCFKEKVVMLVKRILMDLRQNVSSIYELRTNKEASNNKTCSDIENFQTLVEEFTAFFNAVDINFNRVV